MRGLNSRKKLNKISKDLQESKIVQDLIFPESKTKTGRKDVNQQMEKLGVVLRKEKLMKNCQKSIRLLN